MGRASSITKLPVKVREKIGALREQGRTIDEILEHLEKLDVDVSRSALGRHLKKQKQVAGQIIRARQMAEAISSKFDGSESGKVARVNIELLHSMMVPLMIGGDDGETVVLTATDAMRIATTLEKLSKASKIDVDRELKIRAEAEKDALKKAADIVDTTAKEKGLSTEMAEELKRKFLGVPDA